jgi:hypothetical protein
MDQGIQVDKDSCKSSLIQRIASNGCPLILGVRLQKSTPVAAPARPLAMVAKVHSGGRSGETISYGRKVHPWPASQRRSLATVVKSTPVAALARPLAMVARPTPVVRSTETICHGRPKSTPVARPGGDRWQRSPKTHSGGIAV